MARLAALVSLLAVFLVACGVDSEPDRPPSNAYELAEKCFSGWSGNHRGFVDQVKDQLHDPGSMDVHGTYFNTNDGLEDGRIRIRMDYSAANQLGGVSRGNALADMRLDCSINIVQYE
ncbi:MAG: hypothetical protein F4X74_04035 [Acidimicrobiia bacterium]|nr:hypothetical protein [Acidimicrobiia bacterium]